MPFGRCTAPWKTWGSRAVVKGAQGGQRLVRSGMEGAASKWGRLAETSSETARTHDLPWPRAELYPLYSPPMRWPLSRPTVPGSGQSFLGPSGVPAASPVSSIPGILPLRCCHPRELRSEPARLASCWRPPPPLSCLPCFKPPLSGRFLGLISNVLAALLPTGWSSHPIPGRGPRPGDRGPVGRSGDSRTLQRCTPGSRAAAVWPGSLSGRAGTTVIPASHSGRRGGCVWVSASACGLRAPHPCRALFVPGALNHFCCSVFTGALRCQQGRARCRRSAAVTWKSFSV